MKMQASGRTGMWWCGAIGLAAGVTLCVTGTANAVVAERFVHTNEADFEPGTFEGTAVSNLGDLELAPTTALLAELPPNYTVIYDVVELDGVTYVAAGPEGAVFKVVDKSDEVADDAVDEADAADDDADEAEAATMSVELILDVTGEQVFDLVAARGAVAAAISSGTDSRFVVLDTSGGGEHNAFMSLPGTRYIWDVLYLPESGMTLAATGPEGQLLSLDAAGDEPVIEVLLDTPQANILTLAGTPDADGNPGFPVYAGTDTDGILYRIDQNGSSRPIYDAAEPEVAALTVAADGTVYAGTADANQAKPGRMDGAAEEDTGRPDGETLEAELNDADVDGAEPDLPELPAEPRPMAAPSDLADPADQTKDAQAIQEDGAAEQAAADDQAGPAPPADADDPADIVTEGEPEPAQAAEATPITPEQYDALRAEVKKRLDAAAKSGKLAAGGKSATRSANATRARTPGTPQASAKEGNAVYRIDPEGLVTEAFRDTVMILDLFLVETAPQGDRLLIATGSEGQLYEVQLATRETAVLTDLDAEQILRLHTGGDAPLLATANPATLRTLQPAGNQPGTYTSAALDAQQTSLWGKLLIAVTGGDSEAIAVQTRTGVVSDPDAAAWSPWEDANLNEATPAFGIALFDIASPPSRFIQYRLTLASTDDQAPAIDRVELPYVRPNLAPNLTTFTAAYGDTPDDPDEPTPTTVNLEWEAEDPNGDRLRFDVQAKPIRFDGQPVPNGTGWLSVAEDLDESPFEWDTKTMPDGRYVLRVVAHDRLDNPAGSARAGSRRSAPLVVDNTPPFFEKLGPTTQPTADTRGVYAGTAVDLTSPLAAVEFRVADDQPWRPAHPDDLIYDSTNEAFTFTLPRLAPGGHVLSIRVRDTRGNVRYASRFLSVE